MPYLPSGRAIAVSLQPLDELLDRALNERNASLLFFMVELDAGGHDEKEGID
jgi:hypothetical protein